MMQVTRMVKLTVAAATMTALAAACAGPVTRTAGAGSAGPMTAPPTSPPVVASPLSQAGAESVIPDRRVGALFLGDTTTHTCSGSVLASTSGDLILTAAHCLLDGVDTSFVPGFGEGGGDTWHVDAAYLDPRWIAEQDPQADYAIVRVTGGSGASLLAAAGGGLILGSAPAQGSPVTVTGYPMGEGGSPLACRGATTWSPQGFPSLACGGLTDGFSGAPWVSGSTVTGLVGGLDGGGCDDDLSYSPRFDDHIGRLLARAEAGGPGDAAPAALESDC
ncbi:trypsin-like serine peptidase [Mycolicibacterium porcinum]|uniref:Trypsin-like peptidase domain-containing protein n=1 Tax=Mycolicibacterium porcinum TaxID=39693 RepID=A0AAW5TBP6_9MYCO|nr:trypsin-like peptidase domain-containing protein [Mycolicibacterium porcinum]MBX8687512.1 trypsin-like serine protease [Mycobacterium sp. 20091114027_K0903767]CDO30323.1 V8-like Glu-specific endopeptidase [Mycolicibacterium vulneris]MCV7392894.1 trypsin-like peptidase domain-containing protein [Mycolicibacterium porcinum]ORB39542.1 trypsin [Mycolicibacterium porcinum]TVX95581.1 trypsin-like peptidase domain-containing protein [Mycolicibacterium porcinum]